MQVVLYRVAGNLHPRGDFQVVAPLGEMAHQLPLAGG